MSREGAERTAVVLAAWSFAYAIYRAYYAVGGQVGMFGRPESEAQFRTLNGVGAGIIAAAGVLALVAVHVHVVGRALPVLGWVGGVGCCMHALVDWVLRVLSLTGVHPTQLPSGVWVSVDRRAADLQDLFLNEPWFMIEGLLWALLGASHVGESRRQWWLSACVACLLLTVVGILSGVGAIGSVRVG